MSSPIPIPIPTPASPGQRVAPPRDCGAGWYRLQGRGCAPGARWRLVAGGASSSDARIIALDAADGTGRLTSVVLLARPAVALRLEPGEGSPRLGGETAELHRIGRFAALRLMLSRLSRKPGAGPARAARALLDGLAMLPSGFGRAATLLAAHYHAVIGRGPERPGIDGGLRPARSPFRVPVRWHPLRDLVRLDASGQPEWEATGEDPSLLLCHQGAALALAPGWYRLRVRIAPVAGSIRAPALYPDYGAGWSQEDMIRLHEPDRDGRIDQVFLLKKRAVALRFDPSVRRARFAFHQCELAQLGRAGAFVRMLVSRHGSGSAGRRLVDFLRATANQGLSEATDRLYRRHSEPATGGYDAWVASSDTLRRTDLRWLEQRAAALAGGPLISIVVPAYRTPERWLRRCIESVLRQAYPNWELCIADDASPEPHVAGMLRQYAAKDPRIKIVVRERNGHIAEASNSALALATGDFIGLLDHDDELRPHALLEMAEAIAAHPDADLLYSDEDKIDAAGTRFQPNFKPDWNYDLLLSQNYVCHFAVVRAELVRAVGGFRKGFEGSQDHDLFLRCIERLPPGRIHHVPKVLYHWRAIEGSTALARDAKDYAGEAGLRAVAEHLQRTGARATAEPLAHGHYRVRWQLPEPAPRVSIIVPTRDRAALLRACVESVLGLTDYPDFELLVVDNQSEEPEALAYLADLEQRPRVRVLRYPQPFNYSAINNWAAAQATGSVLCLLNNDIEVIAPDWLREMAAQASRTDVGAVGAMLYYPDRTIQHAGVILGIGGIANHAFQHQPAGSPGFCARALVAQNLSAVTGACLVVRRAVFDEVGGLDERLAVAFNDIDFCLRVRAAGYRNLWTPFAELVHHESVSRGADDTPDKRARFVGEVALMQARWGDLLLDDPAYNPNLTLEATDFGCAFPPRHRPEGTP